MIEGHIIMTDGEVDTIMIEETTTDRMTGMTTDVAVTTMTEETMTDTTMIEEEATTITTTGTTPTTETIEMVVTTEGITKTEKEILMKRGLLGIEAMLLLRNRRMSKIRIRIIVNHRVLV